MFEYVDRSNLQPPPSPHRDGCLRTRLFKNCVCGITGSRYSSLNQVESPLALGIAIVTMESKSESKESKEDMAGMPDDVDSEHMKAMWSGQSNVLVAVRVRPLMKHDVIKRSCVRVLDSNVVVIMDPATESNKNDILRANRNREKHYAFDYVLEPGSTQDAAYRHTTKFLIRGVLDGFNATVFAYGQTGSGKTHTMIGTPTDPGIMVKVMNDLFIYSASESRQNRVTYKVTVSFLEVYNENIRDLLSDAEEYLDLREDPIKGPVVAGITEVDAKSSVDIMNLLHQGNAKRFQAATAANEASSRSHAVLQVVVESNDTAPGIVANIKVGKLSLVDLAGSERAANTKNVGARLVEGANINRSLLALGNCINALGEKGNKGNFVPYRDSKLTRLLKDSLGGNCRTVMIANISSSESAFEETLNTLKYANRAKNIKTNVQRNVLNVNYHISEYVQLINNLRGEIKNLKDQISTGSEGPVVSNPSQMLSSPSGLKHPSTPLQILRESMKSSSLLLVPNNKAEGADREFVNGMRQKIVENFQERMQLRRSLIELEDQNVQNSIEVSKRQLVVVQWSEGRGQTPGNVSRENGSKFTADILANANPKIKEAWQECEQLRKAIIKNNGMKKSIAKRLRHNEREAEKFREGLSNKITGEDRRELMELQYQVGRLELENMELEQHRIVHDSILKGKDLIIQKLKLQVAVRDKLIQRQKEVLKANALDNKVGYLQLALMEETLMGDVDVMVPPSSPPRDLASMTQSQSKAPLIPRLDIKQAGPDSYYDEKDGPISDIRYDYSARDNDYGRDNGRDWSEVDVHEQWSDNDTGADSKYSPKYSIGSKLKKKLSNVKHFGGDVDSALDVVSDAAARRPHRGGRLIRAAAARGASDETGGERQQANAPVRPQRAYRYPSYSGDIYQDNAGSSGKRVYDDSHDPYGIQGVTNEDDANGEKINFDRNKSDAYQRDKNTFQRAIERQNRQMNAQIDGSTQQQEYEKWSKSRALGDEGAQGGRQFDFDSNLNINYDAPIEDFAENSVDTIHSDYSDSSVGKNRKNRMMLRQDRQKNKLSSALGNPQSAAEEKPGPSQQLARLKAESKAGPLGNLKSRLHGNMFGNEPMLEAPGMEFHGLHGDRPSNPTTYGFTGEAGFPQMEIIGLGGVSKPLNKVRRGDRLNLNSFKPQIKIAAHVPSGPMDINGNAMNIAVSNINSVYSAVPSIVGKNRSLPVLSRRKDDQPLSARSQQKS